MLPEASEDQQPDREGGSVPRPVRIAGAIVGVLAALLVLAVALTFGGRALLGAFTSDEVRGVYEGVVCEGFLTDEPGIVTDRHGVEAAVAKLWADHDVEFALVVVDHSRGEVPNDFAINLASTWGVGDPAKGNGLVVLVSLDERRVEVAQGSSVEVAGERLADAARTFFQAEEWDPGLFAIVVAVDRELAAGTSR